jgi:hypothetical protein
MGTIQKHFRKMLMGSATKFPVNSPPSSVWPGNTTFPLPLLMPSMEPVGGWRRWKTMILAALEAIVCCFYGMVELLALPGGLAPVLAVGAM